MLRVWAAAWIAVLFFGGSPTVLAQQAPVPAGNAVVPTLMNFSGTLANSNEKPLTGITGVTFSLYAEQEGGAPLWTETQNIQPDRAGHYSVMLGSATNHGLPADLFSSGEARWLGVQVQGQAEQPRVMLLSVPYAMKAVDAETVGGLPPSAFVRAVPSAASSNSTGSTSSNSSVIDALGGTGTTDFIPLWSNSTTLGNSVLFQAGTGSTAKIGINTTAPGATLDIKGSGTVRGTLSLPATAAATTSTAHNSQGLTLSASTYDSSLAKAVNQTFRLQAEPAGCAGCVPSSGSLNLLFGANGATPTETGLSIASNGSITFASGQTFPGTGTVTGVTAGTDLTGGGTSGTVTLNLDTTKVPQLSAANTFTGNQTVNGNLSATGLVTGSGYQIGSNPFDYGSYANENAFLGFAGNMTMTGVKNTATGYKALPANTIGNANTADGVSALDDNTTGGGNTAIGFSALPANTTGSFNTAVGWGALQFSSTGSKNTTLGYFTGVASATALSNATALGANALVQESNAMVLGSIAGVNNAESSTYVGIGTTTPSAPLEVDGPNQADLFIKAPETGIGAGMDFFTTGSVGLQWEILDTGANAAQGPNKLNIRNVNAALDVLTILASGHVGIGTTSPDNVLTVNGNADKPGGGSWGTFSDRRLKTLEGNFDSGLSQILKINPVRYRYKEGNGMGIADREEHVGLVAQEVQKTIPEAVKENDRGFLLVNNDPIIWSMLNAIKEQQKQIAEQQREIGLLNRKVNLLQSSLRTDQAQKPAMLALKPGIGAIVTERTK